MLSRDAVSMLDNMTHGHDAAWCVNILPFGSIYWEDEMPNTSELVQHPEDVLIILSMFGLRLKLWEGEPLTKEEKDLWDSVRQRARRWALFHRIALTNEQERARQEAEHQVEKELGSELL